MRSFLKNIKSRDFLIAGFVWLCLFALALWFYKERTIFVDISFHVFYMIRDNSFEIQNGRFVSVFTQLAPLMASRMHLDLNTILILYSAVFVIYYFLVFVIIYGVFRNTTLAWLYLAMQILFVTDTFYWIQSELPQGMAILFLVIALMQNMTQLPQKAGAMKYFVLYFLIYMTAYAHPILIVPFLFAMLYFRFFDTQKVSKTLIHVTTLAYILIFIVKNYLLRASHHDRDNMERLKNFKEFFPDYIHIPSNIKFVNYCLHDYYFLIIALLFIVGYFLWKRRILLAMLILLSFGVYLLVVNISFPTGGEQFYIENLYLPLGFFVLLPFLDLLEMWKLKEVVFYSLFLIFAGIRLFDISYSSKKFTDRLQWERNFIEKTQNEKQKKIIVGQSLVPIDTLMMSWATPYEFWILSSVEYPEQRSIVIDYGLDKYTWTQDDNTSFITQWGVFPYNELPKNYFNFTDTSKYAIYRDSLPFR